MDVGNLIPSPSACGDFKWTVTEQTATTAKGSFSATCAGDLKLAGIAEGEFTSADESRVEGDRQCDRAGPDVVRHHPDRHCGTAGGLDPGAVLGHTCLG